MTNPSNIERIVMRRIQLLRVLRVVVNGATASVLLLLLTLYAIGREVWVARVFENTPRSGDPSAVAQFWIAAFSQTELLVQALALIGAASLVYVAREGARALGHFVKQPIPA